MPPAEEDPKGVAERVLKTPDGERLVAWYGKARPGQPTILYFHGNAGGLADRAPRVQRFMGEGWASTYWPIAATAAAPAGAAKSSTRGRPRCSGAGGRGPGATCPVRESLGTGRGRAPRHGAAGGRAFILDAPYTSIVEIAARAYFYLPVRYLF